MFHKITRKEAKLKEKHGVKIRVYNTELKQAGFVNVEVKKGHFEEFYHKKSSFIYYIIEGKGTFYLNGRAAKVLAGDLIVIPPLTRIYYLGNMKMTLTTTPAWTTKDEVHVKFIKKK